MNLAVFGDVQSEATRYRTLNGGSQTIVSLFGDVKLTVPPGTRVEVSGFSLFGDSRIAIEDGDDPTLRVNFFSLFGDLTIVEKSAPRLVAEHRGQEGPTFPY